MIAMIHLLGTFVANLFKSRHRLELENLFLRHQLNIALRRTPRLRLRGNDRALLVWMTWLSPSLLGLSRVVRPDTILRWHRAGFRTYWRWKSRGRPGRPRVSRELRELIRVMSKENPLWGAPRIHGELLKLGSRSQSRPFQIHDQASRAAIANLADIPAQPCGCYRRDRSLRGSNPNLRVPICRSRRRSRPAAAALVRGDPIPDGGVAGPTDRGGISVGYGADLFSARQ